ncbi:MAG: Zn-ribbon containing protein [Methanobrevibacter sp. CfCl-M3]
MNVCAKCGFELKEEDILNGCPNCGGKKFKFVNKNPKKNNGKEEDKSIIPKTSITENSIEQVKVEDRGVYEVNVSKLLDGGSDVYSDKEGNYAIDINSLLKKGREKKEN